MIIIFEPEEMLRKGLLLRRDYDSERFNKICEATKMKNFKTDYGVVPELACALWKDLQTCDIEENRINPKKASVDYFLMALYYLRKYPTGHDHSQHFDVSRETITKWTWFFLDRISALQSQKIVWPAEWEKERYAAAKLRGAVEGEVYVVGFGCTVDGTHGPIHEPSVGETRAKNPVYYSHKTNGPAFAYEFALDIFQDRLVWMNGPFPASTPDREIFKNGLMEKIPEGMRVIADRGYSGQPLQHIISLPNPYDNAQLKNFKARASARQEDFNSLLKKFKICELTFRHDRDRIQKHKTAWTAVAIICQYHFEIDKSLWDV